LRAMSTKVGAGSSPVPGTKLIVNRFFSINYFFYENSL